MALCTTAPKYYYSISSLKFAEWFSWKKDMSNWIKIMQLFFFNQCQGKVRQFWQYSILILNLIRNRIQVFVSEKISISTIILVSEIQLEKISFHCSIECEIWLHIRDDLVRLGEFFSQTLNAYVSYQKKKTMIISK